MSVHHSPSRHLHSNLLCLSNVAELATSPYFKSLQKGTQAEAVVNLHSTLCLSLVTGEQREVHLAFAGSLWRPDSARCGLSGGGNVLLCLYPAAFENDREMGDTNGADPPQIEPLRNALECSKMTLCVFRPEPASFRVAKRRIFN